MLFETWPDDETMSLLKMHNEPGKGPNDDPMAVTYTEFLSNSECDNILSLTSKLTPHSFPGCACTTREIDTTPGAPVSFGLEMATATVRGTNHQFWNYDLFDRVFAWHQHYADLESYDKHMDMQVTQTRKLTAVVQLSDKDDYEGGQLIFHTLHGGKYVVPRERGTIVIFQPWVIHEATEVTAGVRDTVNIGFYGPRWK